MKPLAEAQDEVLGAVHPLPVQRVSVWEALGLVPAEDVIAGEDVPPFANSAMDGYAVVSADTTSAPVMLRVLEDVAAGSVATATVSPGSAIKIMTGAPMPPGADAVAKVEITAPGDGVVQILETVAPWTSVREAGGDVVAGDVVVEAGTRLGPQHLGVLAAAGAATVAVRRRPRVALISTGDEVQPPETVRLRPGQIRDANRPLLVGLLSELGAEIRDFGIVPDDARQLRATLERAASDCDAVFTSGGVSMGEYDLVKKVLSELGDIELWRVAMKPAKPFAFGRITGTPLFGLPGNPVSVMVAFEQFARPALLKMMGATSLFRPLLRARAAHRIDTDVEKTVFIRVFVRAGSDGRLLVTESGSQMSNVLSSAAAADAFVVVPVGVGAIEAGDPVMMEMFRWPENRTLEEARSG